MTFQRNVQRCVTLFLALGLSAFAHSQSTTQGAISGTVFDATDAAVPNATVLIHNDGTNADINLVSDSSGFYKAPQLAPGTYTVTISASGFSAQRSSNVVVQVNLVTEVNPHLQLGTTSQVVEVTADVPVLKFDTPSYGGQLSNTEIENIPINNRRWSSLSLLTPGVTNDAQGFGLISFRAIQPQLNNVQIDGADDNQVFYGEERGRTRAGYSTSQTAIREFQINTGVYSAEFGRAVGGVINSVTKSGTNQIHGEAYFYHRDQQWGAKNNFVFKTLYDTATSTATQQHYKAKDKRNQYGFGVGGPLIKDKLFFFYAFDQFRRVFPGTAQASTTGFYADPTAAQQTTLATRLSNSTGAPVTAAQALATYRNYVSILNTDLGPVSRIGFQIINTPKLDYTINDKNHVSVLYHRLRWDSPGGVQTQSVNNYGTDGFGNDFVKLDYTLAKLDSLIGSRIANELRYQYGRELNYETAQANSAFTNKYLVNPQGVAPQVTTNGGNAFITGQPYYAFRPALPDERKWQIGDSASVQFGKNNVKFGVDVVHNYDINNTLGFSGYSPNGTFTYATQLDYISDLAVGNSSAFTVAKHGACGTVAAPVGCYQTFRETVGPSTFDLATVDYGIFLQDDWKITPRLALNLGVRYDYESIPDAYPNLIVSNFAPSANKISDKNNVAPRLGFAWDPFGLGKTTVRGGFGMYYGRIPNVNILSARFSTGSTNGQLSYSATPTAATPLLGLTPTSISSIPDIQYISSNLQNPYTEQFDFAVQQDLGWNTVLSVSYLGSLGKELPNSLNLNLDPTKTYNVNYVATAGTNGSCGPLVCGSVITQKVYGQRAVGQTAATTLNPAYNNIYAGVSNVNSSYNALTVEVQKRANKYISYDANYTWSHALDFNQTSVTGFSSNNWFDPYANARSNYGNSYLNVKHRAVGWAIFNIPGAGSNHYVRSVTSGWSIKPALQVQSGLPYSASASPTPAGQCTSAAVGTTPACLTANNTGLAGTGVTYIPQIGRNTFTYPRDISLDLRIQRDFKLSDRFNFQVIAESFNVANHQNVTGINTTAFSAGTTTPAATTASTPVQQLVYSSTFGAVTNSNNNYAYGPRTIQAGGRLFF